MAEKEIEAVKKSEEEALKIIANAEKEADTIIKSAKAQGETTCKQEISKFKEGMKARMTEAEIQIKTEADNIRKQGTTGIMLFHISYPK
jgi:vacuolar-type H+-ATPase subunit H